MLVNTLNDLDNVRTNLTGNYALGRDIDATATATWNGGAGFTPIGNDNGERELARHFRRAEPHDQRADGR